MGGVAFAELTEAEWLSSDDPDALLGHIAPRLTRRQAALFACACCRRLWPLVTDDRWRRVVELRERQAAGEDTGGGAAAVYGWYLAESRAGRFRTWPPLIPFVQLAGPDFGDPRWVGHAAKMARQGAGGAAALAVRAAGGRRGEQEAAKKAAERAEAAAQCGVLREIVGNPFRPAGPTEQGPAEPIAAPDRGGRTD
ncbi:MAG TPA: hypothetical protein VGF55_14745 [Gemmataceae bacterium]|jgi:hypothetical protein